MRKAALLVALALVAALQISMAWNAHLLSAAREQTGGAGRAIQLLERAGRVYPWNDAVHFELGRALFEQAAGTLGDPAARDEGLHRSAAAFVAALRLNPVSAAAHFHFAQTLLYMSYLSLSAPETPFEEYRKAAALAGHNSQIFFEVGRVLLERWEGLRAEEREFTRDILTRALAGGSEERLETLLETWRLAGADPEVMDAILPSDPKPLRAYARFLGERALLVEVRQAALARAEHLEFLRARDDLIIGERALDYFRAAEAVDRLRSCLRALDSIRFYQSAAGLDLIDPAEFRSTRVTALRLLAQERIERTRSLEDPEGTIAGYLELEDHVPAIGEFERFIRERGLLGEPGQAARAGDLGALAFQMTLDFKQNRYRDIVRAADLLASSVLVIPESAKPSYVRILVLLGESGLKLDSVYEAEDHFRKALEIAPDDLEALLGIERCYERLNDGPKAAAARRAIDGLLTPARLEIDAGPIENGTSRTVPLVLDGRPRILRIEFDATGDGEPFLAAAVFNGRLAWEGGLVEGAAVFPVSPRVGRNSLEIVAVGGAARPLRIVQYPAAR